MGDIALQELTPEVAHFDAGGTTNTIAQLMARSDDGRGRRFQPQSEARHPPIETDGWAEKAGIPLERGAGPGKDELNIEAFAQYRESAKKSASSYIESMDLKDLDKAVEWFDGPRPAHHIIQIIVINHMLGHSGEVSTLKGVQGLKGLPF